MISIFVPILPVIQGFLRISGNLGVMKLQSLPCPGGNVFYVKYDANGNNDGTSWADAFTDLQSALASTCPGITDIWVAAGTYKPSVYPAGCSGCATDRDFTFLLKDGVSLYGGFDGTETMLSERDFANNETILSGDFNGDDVVTGNGSNLSISNNGENAHHVILSLSDSSSTVLDGFTISGGNADGSSIISVESNNIFRNDGGGIYSRDSILNITNTTFTGNSADNGGGIYSRDSISNITNTTFTRNSADEGGGMFNDESNPDITNTNFADNMATEGGGIYNFNTNSSSNINNNSFNGNSATEGGGIFNLNSSPGITDTSFSNNTATNGGGIYNDQTSSPNITNTTFTDNSASFDGGGMFNKSSSPSITNTSFTNNSANSSGGGMYNNDSSLSITNTTFTGNLGNEGGGMNNRNSDLSITNSIFIGNSASDDGGAINNSDSNPSITNTTFVDNSATNFGGVIYDVNSSPTLTNCILWGNSSGIYNFSGNPTISHSILEGSGGSGSWDTNIGTDGGNNLDQDPLLVDAANGDLNLQPGSPAINAGDNTAYSNIPGNDINNDTDLAGNPRLSGSTIDMGAYEFNSDFYLDDNGVTSICETADFGDTETLIINGVSKTFTKRTRAQLDALIDADQNDPQIALTCTSGITDMFELFFLKFNFNQDISSWDVSNVTNMRKMFRSATSFNQPLDVWDVSHVTDMSDMFWNGNFNQSLNDWDVSNVTDMKFMFAFSNFNQPLDNWDVSNVTNMRAMFKTIEEFNQPLSDWDVSNVTNMSEMFIGTDFFNQPLNDWDVTHVTNMSGML